MTLFKTVVNSTLIAFVLTAGVACQQEAPEEKPVVEAESNATETTAKDSNTTDETKATDVQQKPFTAEEVKALEDTWGAGIVEIGKVFQEKGDYNKTAEDLIAKLYAYEEGQVLFKPTKAADDQFREDKTQALSYFVTGSVKEDGGFAIQPWSKVRFENHDIKLVDNIAIAMGNYYFTDVKTNKEVKVEFTFGFKRSKDGRPVIFLHHSSLPYQAN